MKYKIITTDTGFFTPFVRKGWRWVHLMSIGEPWNRQIIEEKRSGRCSYKEIDHAIEVVKTHALQSTKYWNNQKLKLTIYL